MLSSAGNLVRFKPDSEIKPHRVAEINSFDYTDYCFNVTTPSSNTPANKLLTTPGPVENKWIYSPMPANKISLACVSLSRVALVIASWSPTTREFYVGDFVVPKDSTFDLMKPYNCVYGLSCKGHHVFSVALDSRMNQVPCVKLIDSHTLYMGWSSNANGELKKINIKNILQFNACPCWDFYGDMVTIIRSISHGTGEVVWTDTQKAILGIETDSGENVLVVGFRYNSDGVRKYNSSGVLQWGYDTGTDRNYGIAVDSSDNIYLVGVTSLDEDGGGVAAVRKLNSSGVLQWRYNSGEARCVAVDSYGDVFVGLAKNGTNDTLLLFTPSGSLVAGYYTGDSVEGIVLDSNGNVIAVGPRAQDEDGDTATVRKFGNCFSFPTKQWDYDTTYNLKDVDVDGNGDIYVCGNDTWSWTLNADVPSVWKLNSFGILQWDFVTRSYTYSISVTAKGLVAVGSRNSPNAL